MARSVSFGGEVVRRLAPPPERPPVDLTLASEEPSLFAGTPPVAVLPLLFSQKGLEWRPFPRSHCAGCSGARTWHRPGYGDEAVREKPAGAFGASCRGAGQDCTREAQEVAAYQFHGAECHLEMLDSKLLDDVLGWLGGGVLPSSTGDARRRSQEGEGARALRALAATCRRGRELAASARRVPGISVDLFPHQIAALFRCVQLEARRHIGRVCGGVLCDAAGLGKTVTALALIARGRAPQHPRIPRGTELRGGGDAGAAYYELESFELCGATTRSSERRRAMMARGYSKGGQCAVSEEEPAGRRKSSRRKHDVDRDPAYGYASSGFTKGRKPVRVSPVASCSLLIVPEELERQWQTELQEKTDLRHRIVRHACTRPSTPTHPFSTQTLSFLSFLFRMTI